MSENEMSVENKKMFARNRKESLRYKILLCQKSNQYTMDTLMGKTLKQLESIYEKVVR